MKDLTIFISGVAWIAGFVIAKGFWPTFFACIFPFWAWYLVIELVMFRLGLI